MLTEGQVPTLWKQILLLQGTLTGSPDGLVLHGHVFNERVNPAGADADATTARPGKLFKLTVVHG